jgi:hypothetical protein
MKKFFILILMFWCCFLLFSQEKTIQFTDNNKIPVIDNIEIGSKLVLKKEIYTTIIADIKYCGKSPLDSRNFKFTKMRKNLLKKIIKNNTAYLINQDSSNFYIHSLYGSNLSCEPQRNVKMKVLILNLYDVRKKTESNLILLQ